MVKIFLILIFFSLSSKAQVQDEKLMRDFSKLYEQKTKNKETHNVKDIQEVLLSDYPKEVCNKKNNYLNCYTVTKDQCHLIVKQGLKDCFSKTKSKNQINSLEMYQYSKTVGICMSERNRKALKKYKKNKECK